MRIVCCTSLRLAYICVVSCAIVWSLASPGAFAAPPPNPRVGIMPGFPNAPNCDPSKKRPVRPGVPVIVWGNANGGNGTAIGLPYVISFLPNPNVSVTPVAPPLSGNITNDRYIFEEVTFNLLGGSTLECVTARLSVTFPGPVTLSKSVEIKIVSPADPSSTAPLDNLDINVDIAIEDGLRALYLLQAPNGSWPSVNGQSQYTCASTGFALWAFENHGHLRSNPQGDDIYAEFVERGLEFIMSGAIAAGIVAPNADVPRGATANGISDLNTNGRSIHLCPPGGLSAWYPPPIAAAAVIASLEPSYVVQTGPFTGTTFQTVLEDVVDWIGTAQNSVSASGPRGGWHYSANVGASDMSINSWYYLALEGLQFVLPPCTTSGGGSGIVIPDWIKQEAEHALVYHQTNAAGPQPFGYNSNVPIGGFSEGVATTAGGLSGLALVQSETPTLPVGAILAGAGPPLNTIATKRQAALDHIGVAWNNTVGSTSLGFANRGNFYVMWTAARALRITAKALFLPAGQKVILSHAGVDFDWETGETFIAAVGQGNVPAPGNPREGYFPFLVRTQDTSSGPALRGRWNLGTYLSGFDGSASMETALGVLVLIQSVFGPECQVNCPDDITVKCEGSNGAIVNFNVTAAGCPAGTTIVCNPPSGSLFPIGVTNVQCYAQLPCGNKRSLPCCFKVTVEEPCPCLEVKDTRIVCGKTTGEYNYTFNVTNLSGVPVTRIKLLPCDMDGDFLPDFTMTPDTFNFGTPIPPGGSTSITVTISGADPKKPACFEIWAFDREFKRCCVLKHCVKLPECCAEIIDQKIDCDPAAPGQYIWTFKVRNEAPYTIDRLFIWPPGGVSMTPTSFILPPIPTGGVSGPLSVSISGAVPGTICFDISIHKSATDECCYETICLTLPDCNPCKVEDRCELTPAIKLCREGDLLRGVIKLTICNYCSDQPATFKYSLDGFTDPSCPIQYLTAANFSPSSGVTPPIPKGQCLTIPITITTNFGAFPAGAVACYKATITNVATGDMHMCTGKAKSPKPNSFKIVADPKDPIDVPTGATALAVFEVRNEGQARASLTFQLATALPDVSSSRAISLNGLPPGEPIRRTISVDPGAVTQVGAEVRFLLDAPLGIETLYFLASENAADQTLEPLAAVGLRAVSADDCNQNGVPDDVDIAVCTSLDLNGNGVPDECEGLIPLLPGVSFRRGDANTDGVVDVSDSMAILVYLFAGTGGLACIDAADVNDQGSISIDDAVGVLSYLFLGGSEPAEPGPGACGLDPTEDALDCAQSSLCD